MFPSIDPQSPVKRLETSFNTRLEKGETSMNNPNGFVSCPTFRIIIHKMCF